MYLDDILETKVEIDRTLQYYIYYNDKRIIGPYVTERRAKVECGMIPQLITHQAMVVNSSGDYRLCIFTYTYTYTYENTEYVRHNLFLLTAEETNEVTTLYTIRDQQERTDDSISINGYLRSSIYRRINTKKLNKLLLTTYFTGKVEVRGE